MSGFKWTKKREDAVMMLARGHTIEETARVVGISERQLYRWKDDILFSQELTDLSNIVKTADRAWRLRIANRLFNRVEKDPNYPVKGFIEILKYAQSETDGIKLNLTAKLKEHTPLAGSGSTGTDNQVDE